MSIIVDEEFKNLIPPLTAEEYTQLERNILKDGIRDALIVWRTSPTDYTLIDGHNRFAIAAAHHGILFTTKEIEFADRDEAKLWIIRNQLGQRNLPKIDQAALRAVEHEIISKQAKERHGYRSDLHGDFVEKFPQSGKTRDILGEKIGVSGKTYDKLRVINEKATDRTKQLVREGKLSINQAYNSVHPKQPDPVKQAKAEHEEFEQKKVVGFQDVQKDKANRELIDNALMTAVLKLLGDINKFGMTYKVEDLDPLAAMVEDDEREIYMNMVDTCQRVLYKIQNAFMRRN